MGRTRVVHAQYACTMGQPRSTECRARALGLIRDASAPGRQHRTRHTPCANLQPPYPVPARHQHPPAAAALGQCRGCPAVPLWGQAYADPAAEAVQPRRPLTWLVGRVGCCIS